MFSAAGPPRRGDHRRRFGRTQDVGKPRQYAQPDPDRARRAPNFVGRFVACSIVVDDIEATYQNRSSRAIIQDHPYEAIVATAKEKGCDLIVVASHGRSGLAAVLLGSVTTRVLTHRAIPVLVCH
jgi:nucleotide-binding universal stress UspA family protein